MVLRIVFTIDNQDSINYFHGENYQNEKLALIFGFLLGPFALLHGQPWFIQGTIENCEEGKIMLASYLWRPFQGHRQSGITVWILSFYTFGKCRHWHLPDYFYRQDRWSPKPEQICGIYSQQGEPGDQCSLHGAGDRSPTLKHPWRTRYMPNLWSLNWSMRLN